jgi:hypothetical protein
MGETTACVFQRSGLEAAREHALACIGNAETSLRHTLSTPSRTALPPTIVALGARSVALCDLEQWHDVDTSSGGATQIF